MPLPLAAAEREAVDELRRYEVFPLELANLVDRDNVRC